jgi:hypothetical protein
LLAIAGLSILAGLTSPTIRAQHANPREVFWYRTPAPLWDEALPIGDEQMSGMISLDAGAGVGNIDRYYLVGVHYIRMLMDSDPQRTTIRHGLKGIRDQVHEDLSQFTRKSLNGHIR